MTLSAPLIRLALVSAVALALVACSNPEPATPPASTATATAPTPDVAVDAGAYEWRLAQVRDVDGQPDPGPLGGLERPLELRFADGRLSSNGACNSFGGGYRVEDDKLVVDSLMQTQRACPGGAMEADTRLIEFIEGTPRFELAAGTPPTLTLAAKDGRTLVFEGDPTPETRYGSAGERMFLEVAARREACAHPLIPDMQCLMVREVRYDDAGVQTRVSEEWQPLYQDIEGYEHNDGVRNVLRIDRFDIADPPADAPSVAYVLDMVVESETEAAR